jgi:hypothetical protein
MSRFWNGSDSSEESEQDTSSSDESEEQVLKTDRKFAAAVFEESDSGK